VRGRLAERTRRREKEEGAERREVKGLWIKRVGK